MKEKNEKNENNLSSLEKLTNTLIDRDLEIKSLYQALSQAIEGISKIDIAGNYVYVNNTYANMAGYEDPQELVGKAWEQTVFKDDVEEMNVAYNIMLVEGKVRRICRGIKKDGTVFTKEVFMVTIKDQNKVLGHWCFMTLPYSNENNQTII